MNKQPLIELAYLLSVVLFVVGLKRLSGPKTARGGNVLASVAMLIAIVATLLHTEVVPHVISYTMLAAGFIVGAIVGAAFAIRVQMTAMPQMVALFNGFGGLASALVALSERSAGVPGHMQVAVAMTLSVLIGAVTFTGSVVAFGKLQGLVPSQPITYPAQNIFNGLLFLLVIVLMVMFCYNPVGWWALIVVVVLSSVMGVLLVIPIGGADMPVVISLLNSYSGLAACATGFVLRNDLLIIAGSLVGASGLILTNAMCVAMNRSIGNVVFGAFGVADSTGTAGPQDQKKQVRHYTLDDAVMVLDSASSVIIIPGYGLAVARAQHIVRELDELLEKKGATVRYAIHPVAGRMPGHMNVLLAEANVPYEKLVEMDQINPEFETTDVALVLGANDVINPAARYDKGSPIYGMPILDVDKARSVIICKRSLSAGFAGIDNELFYSDRTMMIFGDAKATVTSLVEAFRDGQ